MNGTHLTEPVRNANGCNAVSAFTQRDKTCFADNGGIGRNRIRDRKLRIEARDRKLWAVGNATEGTLIKKQNRKHRRKEAPDWFGCGRVITQESWDGFLAARRDYYARIEKTPLA